MNTGSKAKVAADLTVTKYVPPEHVAHPGDQRAHVTVGLCWCGALPEKLA